MFKKFFTYILAYCLPLMLIMPFYPQYTIGSGILYGFITGFICSVLLITFNTILGRWLK